MKAIPVNLLVPFTVGHGMTLVGYFLFQMGMVVSTGLLQPKTLWRTWSKEASGVFMSIVWTTYW